MDTQETGSTRQQHVADGLAVAISESVERVAFENTVDGAVVVITGLDILVDVTSTDEIGQQARRGVGEYITVSDMMTSLVGLDDDTRHHERCAAQLEEVVGGACLVHGQNVAVNLAEEAFRVVGGLHVFVVGGLDDGCGQRLAVHLLVLVERDDINLHRGGRNHVGRLLLADEGVEFLDVDLLVADDVGGDVLAAVLILKGLHGGILDARVLADDSLHLFQLDAEATDLHLAVLTADKLDVAVGEVAHNVSRAIDFGEMRIEK